MHDIAVEDDVDRDPPYEAPAPEPSGAACSAAAVPASGPQPPGDQAIGTGERAQELGLFLRNRRARIRPEQVGFPVGPHRRSRGLRREEVAVLAGVSPTWYTYLEQGRKIRPSPEVLDSLANVLALSEGERHYIHLLALGHRPANSRTSPASTDTDLLWAVISSIGSGPDPVYIGNQYGDVLAWNEATTAWFTDFAALPAPRRNMLWWLLTDPRARERVVSWEADTRDIVARLRAAYATRPQDPRFEETVRYLAAASSEFRDWWNAHDVSDQRTRVRTLRAPGLGTASFRIVVMRMTDDTANAVILHVPTRLTGDGGGGGGPT